jgi:hypothetical protein
VTHMGPPTIDIPIVSHRLSSRSHILDPPTIDTPVISHRLSNHYKKTLNYIYDVGFCSKMYPDLEEKSGGGAQASVRSGGRR